MMRPFMAFFGNGLVRFLSITFALAMVFGVGISVLPTTQCAYAQTLTATHSAPASYGQGQEVTVTNHIEYSFDDDLTALGLKITLPSGWVYIGKQGEDIPSTKEKISGDLEVDGKLEFYWTEMPASPIDFTYTVKASEGSIGEQEISATVLYRHGDSGEITKTVETSPITLTCPTCPVDPPNSLNVTYTSEDYMPGNNYTVEAEIMYVGDLSDLDAEVDVPDGWTYVSVGGNDAPGVNVLDDGDLEFYWPKDTDDTKLPASPVTFTYTLLPAGWVTGEHEISNEVSYQFEGESKDEKTDTLTVSPAPSAEWLTMDHSSGQYVAGSNLVVSNQIKYGGNLTALGVRVTLPDGWKYFSYGGADAPAGVKELDTGETEFYWTEIPSGTIDFTYTVTVPEGAAGPQEISAKVLYRHGGGEEIQKNGCAGSAHR